MKIKRVFWLLTFIITGALLYSHPHLFIKPTIEVISNNSSIEGVWLDWEWDQWWSEDVLFECDLDGNGSFSKDEIELIYNDFFIGIEDFDFFTYISVDGKRYQIMGVENFTASNSSSNIVSYRFYIPLEVEGGSPKSVEVSFNDTTSYTAFEEKIKVTIKKGPAKLGALTSEKYSFYGAKVAFKLTF